MSRDPSQFLEVFLRQCLEVVQAMESELSGTRDGGISAGTLDALLRAARSVKGGARSFDLSGIAGQAGTLEALLLDLRAGRRTADSAAVSELMDAISAIRWGLAAPRSARRRTDRGGEVTPVVKDPSSVERHFANLIADIDEIAFRTNLLALSAAVDAARDGDASNSLSAVAREARDLARRSAAAARSLRDRMVETGATASAPGGWTAATGEVSAFPAPEDAPRVRLPSSPGEPYGGPERRSAHRPWSRPSAFLPRDDGGFEEF